jgi:pantetheine-phosphate adenylyltransferase
MSIVPTALYPGSFDPVTRGHLDVIARAARLFSKLHVGVLENPSKTALFSAAERVALIEAETRGIGNVEVISFGGLAVEAAAKVGAGWIVRGLRSEADTAHEIAMARSNRLCGTRELETIFIPASAEVAFISSTLVREIAARGGKLSPFVPPNVEKALRAKAR